LTKYRKRVFKFSSLFLEDYLGADSDIDENEMEEISDSDASDSDSERESNAQSAEIPQVQNLVIKIPLIE